MAISDRELLGTRGELAEMDRRNAEHMYCSYGGGHDAYYLDCPLDAIEDVARGLRPESSVIFLLKRHVIQIGDLEWPLDGDLRQWREASMYAEHLREHGLLNCQKSNGMVEYRRLT